MSATELADLDAKLKTILPEEYQECYEDVQPVSMGSAGLKFDAAGRVAWDEIWGSFCDLAMAGGPPHRGTLLEPATEAEMLSDPSQYRVVVDEICRGIRMVTDLAVEPSNDAGWVQLYCANAGMAGWMTRAIVMENVSARADGAAVLLPAGPKYRLEKEIKNVVTSVAKTAHYFVDHMGARQKKAIAKLFEKATLLQPGIADTPLRSIAAERLLHHTGLRAAGPEYRGWLGLECESVGMAIWMMRALVVNSVLARREGTVLYVPVNPALDPNADRVADAVALVRRLALAQN